MIPYLIAWLILINGTAFLLFGIDKRKARKDRWRIGEQTLLLCMLMGGAFGGYAAMKLFHHKTRKKIFRICAYAGMILWFVLILLIMKKEIV